MTGHDPYRAATPTVADVAEESPPTSVVAYTEDGTPVHLVALSLDQLAETFDPDAMTFRVPAGMFAADVAVGDRVATIIEGSDDEAVQEAIDDPEGVVVEIVDDVVTVGRVPGDVPVWEIELPDGVELETVADTVGDELDDRVIIAAEFAALGPEDAEIVAGDRVVIVRDGDALAHGVVDVGLDDGTLLVRLDVPPGPETIAVPRDVTVTVDPDMAGTVVMVPRDLFPPDVETGHVFFLHDAGAEDDTNDETVRVVSVIDGVVRVQVVEETDAETVTGDATGDGPTAPETAPDGSGTQPTPDDGSAPETGTERPENGNDTQGAPVYGDDAVPAGAPEAVAWIDDGEDRDDQIARAGAARKVENAKPESARRKTVLEAIAAVLDT